MLVLVKRGHKDKTTNRTDKLKSDTYRVWVDEGLKICLESLVHNKQRTINWVGLNAEVIFVGDLLNAYLSIVHSSPYVGSWTDLGNRLSEPVL